MRGATAFAEEVIKAINLFRSNLTTTTKLFREVFLQNKLKQNERFKSLTKVKWVCECGLPNVISYGFLKC